MFHIETKPNGIRVLFIDHNGIMSDSLQEYVEHQPFLEQGLSGHLLITGLGLGFINKFLLTISDIKSVTIVEKYQEVIDLVWDSCSKDERFMLVLADAETWEPPRIYDYTWIDSWVGDTIHPSDEWVKTMKERYAPFSKNLLFWYPNKDRQHIEQVYNEEII